MLSVLRGVLEKAWLLGYMSSDDYLKATRIETVTGSTLPAGRAVPSGELKAVMAECESDPITTAGIRDAAIVGVSYSGGLRRAELAGLDLDDCTYNQETGEWSLKILGKRNKERVTFINNGAGDALSDWVAIRGDEPGPLFLRINKSGKFETDENGERIYNRITTQAIYNIMEKRGKQAKVKSFSPHDLRRSYISDLLDEGVDISTVAKMAGHSSVTTTARYDRRDEKAMQAASKRLSVPYTRRMG